MIMRAPEKTPPAPIPATALPKMNTGLFGAAAQIIEPTMNSDITKANTVFTPKVWYNLPKIG